MQMLQRSRSRQIWQSTNKSSSRFSNRGRQRLHRANTDCRYLPWRLGTAAVVSIHAPLAGSDYQTNREPICFDNGHVISKRGGFISTLPSRGATGSQVTGREDADQCLFSCTREFDNPVALERTSLRERQINPIENCQFVRRSVTSWYDFGGSTLPLAGFSDFATGRTTDPG